MAPSSTTGKKSKIPKTPPGPCGNCGETDQINYVRVTRKGMDDDLPWIESPPLTEEETKKKKDAELAAKRKEVEERVKKALEER